MFDFVPTATNENTESSTYEYTITSIIESYIRYLLSVKELF